MTKGSPGEPTSSRRAGDDSARSCPSGARSIRSERFADGSGEARSRVAVHARAVRMSVVGLQGAKRIACAGRTRIGDRRELKHLRQEQLTEKRSSRGFRTLTQSDRVCRIPKTGVCVLVPDRRLPCGKQLFSAYYCGVNIRALSANQSINS